MKRITRNYGTGLVKYFGSEDGKHYRGLRQNLAPIKKHVEQLNHKVNDAPSRGNREQWQYLGSIPKVFLQHWLQNTGTPMDVFARNEGGARDKFIKWLRSEHPGLFPKAGAAARPTVAVSANIVRTAPERPQEPRTIIEVA
jgi:hypothetical protein